MNNFNLIRLCLSMFVFFAHLSVLTQQPEFEYLAIYFDSDFAVKCFFAISGFLVTKSYIQTNSITLYFKKRFFRIYPAYTIVILFSFFIGSYLSKLSAIDYSSTPQTYLYLFSNLILLNFIEPSLPRVFDDHFINAINGSLWTIKIEVMFYILLPLFLKVSKKINLIFLAAILVLFSQAWVIYFSQYHLSPNGQLIARQLPGQLSYFIVGSFLCLSEKKLPIQIKYALPLFILYFIIDVGIISQILRPIVYGYFILALAKAPSFLPRFHHFPDISYGLYLYHFLIIQIFIDMNLLQRYPFIAALLCLFSTIILAYISSVFVESKFIVSKSHHLK